LHRRENRIREIGSQTCPACQYKLIILKERIVEVPLAYKMPAVVSKRGVDDGNQKGGDSLQPAKESRIYYNTY